MKKVLPTRLLVLLLLLAPLLLFGTMLFRDRAVRQPLLEHLDVAAIAEIGIGHGQQQLLLKRRNAASPWQIRSAADAPGDATRIDALLRDLQTLDGRPDAGQALADDPVRVRLADADGRTLVELAFWGGHARRLPDGPALKLRQSPLLPLWASPWSSLQPPAIAGRLATVARITRGGLEPLDDAAAAAVAAVLGRLTAVQFVPAIDLDWAPARMLRLTLRDGTVIDAAQTTDRAGRIYLRFESERDAGVRETGRFAFRTAEPLP